MAVSNKYLEKVLLLHGTTPEAIEKIRKEGISPEFQGTGLGAPDLLDGKKVMSYTANPDVARIYSRHPSLFKTMFGKKVDPLLVRVPVEGSKEVTKDCIHHEVHSTSRIPIEDIVFPENPSYGQLLEELSRNRP